MTLVIIGNSLERTLPVAAVASLTSGEQVQFSSEQDIGALEVSVEGNGFEGSAFIQSVDLHTVPDAESYVITAPSIELEEIYGRAPEKFAGKRILLAPGGFGGALVSAARFRQRDLVVPSFSEVPGWMFGGNLVGGTVQMFMRKRDLDFATASDEQTDIALKHFVQYFPDLVPSDLVTTSLSNVNGVIHPPLSVLNATRIENQETWHYWDDGFTPAVARLTEAIDQERQNVVEALGGRSESIVEISMKAYRADGMQGSNWYEAVKSFRGYRDRVGPTDLDSRFLTDDVPYGVSVYEELARKIGLDHSALTSLRVMSEIILGRELKADPAAVDALIGYSKNRRPAPIAAKSHGS